MLRDVSSGSKLFAKHFILVCRVGRVKANTIIILNIGTNSVDPDQTPRSAASDQGLHCLPFTQHYLDTSTGRTIDFHENLEQVW